MGVVYSAVGAARLARKPKEMATVRREE